MRSGGELRTRGCSRPRTPPRSGQRKPVCCILFFCSPNCKNVQSKVLKTQLCSPRFGLCSPAFGWTAKSNCKKDRFTKCVLIYGFTAAPKALLLLAPGRRQRASSMARLPTLRLSVLAYRFSVTVYEIWNAPTTLSVIRYMVYAGSIL